MSTTTITVCKSCLDVKSVDSDGLCAACADFNEAVDGTLLALLNADKGDQ